MLGLAEDEVLLPDINVSSIVVISVTAVCGIWVLLTVRRLRGASQRYTLAKVAEEREAGRHLCISVIEALGFALDAADPYGSGHLECVQNCALSTGRAMGLNEQDMTALRVAALLHNIGRLGVPEHIFRKASSLTADEMEKLRTHPVLGARILASVPFPWQVVDLVRHHAEHWDGSGYPDGLKGSHIPVGARVLAVANAYSALQHERPYRPALSPLEAIAQIEARSGTQFDPGVVAAFRSAVSQMHLEDSSGVHPSLAMTVEDGRAALQDIALAQKESLVLQELTRALSGSLHLEAAADTLMKSVSVLTGCDGCVLFLPEPAGEYLRAVAAFGSNRRHLLGSSARVGAYLTGRAYYRNEVVHASFLADDIMLRNVSETWEAFRSTLIVPLNAGEHCVGVINLYSITPEAFDHETERVMRLVAGQAGHALESARRFKEAQESAYTDSLTGLRNNRYLREYLEKETNRTSRDGSTLAVLNIDLDQFKPINDQYGHAMGDQILKDIGDILQSHVRNYDLAARYAGDEFVVVLSRADRPGAEIAAGKLRKAVEKYAQRVALRDPQFPMLGLSIGIAICPEDGTDLQELLRKSDGAMYADKRSRRSGRAA